MFFCLANEECVKCGVTQCFLANKTEKCQCKHINLLCTRRMFTGDGRKA